MRARWIIKYVEIFRRFTNGSARPRPNLKHDTNSNLWILNLKHCKSGLCRLRNKKIYNILEKIHPGKVFNTNSQGVVDSVNQKS